MGLDIGLFGFGKHDIIYSKIRYFIGLKNSITYVFSYSYVKMEIDSYNSLPLEKRLTLHVIIHIMSAFRERSKSPLLQNILGTMFLSISELF